MCVMTIEGWKIVADVIGHVIWPLLIAVALAVFYKPIYDFLSEADEAGWGNAKVRRGNQQSKNLKVEVVGDGKKADDLDDTSDVTEGTDYYETLNLTTTGGLELGDSTGAQPATGQEPSDERVATLRYYGRIVADRLSNSKYNTSTSSARLGSEIVGSSYADLKQTVRMVAFSVQGIGGKRGPLSSLPVTIDGLNLPPELATEILRARQFATDVTDGSIRVNGQGAEDFIDSVAALVKRLVGWGVRTIEQGHS